MIAFYVERNDEVSERRQYRREKTIWYISGFDSRHTCKKKKKMGNLRKAWNKTCLNAGIPSISLDKAALTCAVLLEYGNNEAFTLNDKFLSDIEYIQKRYRIFGAETPDAEFAEALKKYVTKINEFEKENGHDKKPEWAEKYFKEMYNIQI